MKADYEVHGVVAVRVSAFRQRGLGITFTFEEGNPNHCEVFGARSKSLQRQISAEARWVLRPKGVGEDIIPELFDPQA